ncbi:MAG: sugar porter family MFS transporter [Bacteroidota bacterium]|nr:sugar porter family MFS transporter [Bacteroidota bacterium]
MVKNEFNLKYVTRIALTAALGGLLFGYDWVVIGGAKPFYEQFFQIAHNPSLQGWAMSSALLGCVIGAVISGFLAGRYGRKKLLILASLLFLVSAAGTGGSSNFTIFICYRILGGMGIGLASNLSPVYIAEVAPAGLRGRFVALNQLTIVIGILLAQIINWIIAEPVPDDSTGTFILNSWNGQNGWRYMFWAEAVPAGLFFLCMWFVPESPRWLIKREQSKKARTILSRIGGEIYSKETAREIESTLRFETSKSKPVSILSKSIFPVVLIGVLLALFQQWCGINVIFLYAEEVFSAAGYSVSDMLFNVMITGSVNLVFTFVALALVDRIGRKKLMLIGSGGLALIYLLVGTLYYTGSTGLPLLIFVVAAIACYAMTLAPVTWVVLSEIFPNKVRGAAMAVATFALWTGNALLAYFFPIINNRVNASGSFWIFALICIAGFFYIKTRLIETKGKSLEEIEKALLKKNSI